MCKFAPPPCFPCEHRGFSILAHSAQTASALDIRITPDQLQRHELHAFLKSQFPQYAFTARGKRGIFATDGKKAGAIIKVKKRRINLDDAFASRTGTVVWGIALMIFGVILPLIWYGVAKRKAMVNFRKELAEPIRAQYGVES